MTDRVQLVQMSSVNPDPYPPNLEPYPPDDSYAAGFGLGVFNLITPDGHRVWVVAGWKDNSQLVAWTVQDFVQERRPSKVTADWPSYAPLTRINESADLREQFISDYLAARHKTGEQWWRFGIHEPQNSSEWIGKKVYPYGRTGREHIVRDCDPYFRTLLLDPVRAGNPNHYEPFDLWEITASWHALSTETQARPIMPTPQEQYLYRLYDRGGRLLYVGVTTNVIRRWNEHSKDKPWWCHVHTFTRDWYPDRASVEAAEKHAIRSEQPLYNVTHSRAIPSEGSH